MKKQTVKFLAVLVLSLMTPLMASAQNWVTGHPGSVPADAIVGGVDNHGSPLYVCHGGWLEGFGSQPGKFRSDFNGCDFGYGGKEVIATDFEFLISSWQNASGGFVPPNAVIGGCEAGPPFCGASLFFCRASVPGFQGLQPGKIRPGFSGCNIPFNGQELIESSYQVLVALSPAMPLSGLDASNGTVPFGAVRGGTDVGGQPLYLCSARYNGGLHPGKLRREFGACYIPFGGHEVALKNYAVLVPRWLAFPPAGNIIPSFDFQTGNEADGTPLYTCRDLFNGGIHPGKYLESIGRCNFGWGGREQSQSVGFEVLTDWTERIH
jgi:Protein of unknown function (DUF3421)